MKAVLIAACGFISILHCSAQNNGNNNTRIPALPTGWLTAYPTVVTTGTKPTLNWAITYPSIVEDYVTIVPPATLHPNEKVDVEVRVLGNGVTAHNSSGQFVAWVEAQAQISYNGGSYTPVFTGTNLEVNPNHVVWSEKNVQPDQTIRFGGRYRWNDNWSPFYHSSGGTMNVRTLVNGAFPPQSANQPMHESPTLEDFIRPYLDGNGRVEIGPMDVIVFMELAHTDSQMSDPGYDMQDLVLLVTFKADKEKNNNGHGNNIDGIDSSNPGNAPFMQYDTDPNFDDEGSGGGAFPSSE